MADAAFVAWTSVSIFNLISLFLLYPQFGDYPLDTWPEKPNLSIILHLFFPLDFVDIYLSSLS